MKNDAPSPYALKILAIPQWHNAVLLASPSPGNPLTALAAFCEQLAALGIDARKDEETFAAVREMEYDAYQEMARARRREALQAGVTYVLYDIYDTIHASLANRISFVKRDLKGAYCIPQSEFIRDVLVERESGGKDCPMNARWPGDVIGAKKPRTPKPPKTPPVSERFQKIAALFGIKNQIGFSEERVAACEKKHGKLPEVLRAYYLELGAHEALNRTQDCLLAPDQLRETETHLVFYAENQDVCVWGFPKKRRGSPRVECSHDGKTWLPDAASLDDFLLKMACLQAAFAYEFSTEEFNGISPESAEKVRAAFRKVCEGVLYNEKLEIFSWNNAIIVLLKNGEAYDLLYSAPGEGRFEALDEKMNGLLESGES